MADVERSVGAELDRIAPVLDPLGALFAEAGHELALVGGPVRDAMLGRAHNDLDFTTSARPEETERLLRRWGTRCGTWGATSAPSAPARVRGRSR
jgi:poly(A) polymerase